MLNRFLKRKNKAPSVAARASIAYPPPDPGIPSVDPQEIRAGQRDLELKIEAALGLGKEFRGLIEPVLDRFARLVHLLPAAQSHHHAGIGGMYRHCLEVAHHTVVGTEGVVMVSYFEGTPKSRRSREIRWRVAAFLAGLFHDLGKVITDVRVTDEEGQLWSPILMPLYDWCEENGIDRYFIDFRRNRNAKHETAGVDVVHHVWHNELKEWLAEPGNDILASLNSVIAGMTPNSQLGQLVRAADQRSVELDLKSKPSEQASPVGVSTARHIVDAMRRLIEKGTWPVNRKGARVWVSRDGPDVYAYVIWHQGAKEIAKLLLQDKVPGIPRDPSSMAEILFDTRQAIPCIDDERERLYWYIRTSYTNGKALYALKLPADLVLPNTQPEAIDVEVVSQTAEEDVDVETDEHENDSSEREHSEAAEQTEKNAAVIEKYHEEDSAEALDLDAQAEAAVAIEQQNDPGLEAAGTEGQSERTAKGESESGAKKAAGSQGESVSDKGNQQHENKTPAKKKSTTATGTKKSTDSGPAKDAADSPEEWLKQNGDDEGLISGWLIDISKNAWQDLVTDTGRRIQLFWPDATERVDCDRKALLQGLTDLGWLQVGFGTPIQSAQGRNVIAIKPRVAAKLRALAGTDKTPIPKEPVKSAKSPTPETGPPPGTPHEQAPSNEEAVERSSDRGSKDIEEESAETGANGADEPGVTSIKDTPCSSAQSSKSEREQLESVIDELVPPGSGSKFQVSKLKDWLIKTHPEIPIFAFRAALDDYADIEVKRGFICRSSQIELDYQ